MLHTIEGITCKTGGMVLQLTMKSKCDLTRPAVAEDHHNEVYIEG